MLLGIEIGGTKLQLGVSAAAGSEFAAFERRDIDPAAGAGGIRNQIADVGRDLCERFSVKRIGYGFGGPVDQGTTITSHQISGWDRFPLQQWTENKFGLPAVVGNDCDVAALAEATAGAGRDCSKVFYVTVGTGIGGGFVLDGHIHGTDRPAASEIGHLRPGLNCDSAHDTVEATASGWGIMRIAKERIGSASEEDSDDLKKRCGSIGDLTTKALGESANAGNEYARGIFHDCLQTLGWAVAQVITITSAEVVVIGGGVSLIGEDLFFAPVRSAVAKYTFPPLTNAYKIVPAKLGEDVVVHGAIALAAK